MEEAIGESDEDEETCWKNDTCAAILGDIISAEARAST